jgi:putative membrane protein
VTEKSLRRRWLGELAFAAGLGATVWLVVDLGWRPIGQALAAIGLGGVLVLALAHGPTLVVLGLAWRLLARDAAETTPWTFVWGRVMRDAGGELLPFAQVGGFALGVRAVALGGAPGVGAVVSGLVDVFVEQAAKIPYSLAALLLLLLLAPQSRLAGPAAGVIALSALVLVLIAGRRRWVRRRIQAMASAFAARWPGPGAPDPADAEAAVARSFPPARRIGESAGLHLIGWCLGAAEAWLAFRLLGAEIDLAQALVIDGLFTAIRVFAFTVPAAVGVQEAAYVVLAGLFAIPPPVAVAFSLARRGRDLAIGAPALIAWQLRERAERRRLQGAKLAPDGLVAVEALDDHHPHNRQRHAEQRAQGAEDEGEAQQGEEGHHGRQGDEPALDQRQQDVVLELLDQDVEGEGPGRLVQPGQKGEQKGGDGGDDRADDRHELGQSREQAERHRRRDADHPHAQARQDADAGHGDELGQQPFA